MIVVVAVVRHIVVVMMVRAWPVIGVRWIVMVVPRVVVAVVVTAIVSVISVVVVPI